MSITFTLSSEVILNRFPRSCDIDANGVTGQRFRRYLRNNDCYESASAAKTLPIQTLIFATMMSVSEDQYYGVITNFGVPNLFRRVTGPPYRSYVELLVN